MSKYLKGSLLVSPLLFLSFLFVGLAFAQDGGPDVLPGKLSIPSVLGASTSTTWQNINSDVNISGNVGIGTTGPGYPLDVNGNGRIGSNGSGLMYLGNRGYYIGDDLVGSDIQTNAPDMYVYNNSNWRRLLRDDEVGSSIGSVTSLSAGSNIVLSPTNPISSTGTIAVNANPGFTSVSLTDRTGGATWRAIGDAGRDDWLRLNIDQAFGGIALYNPVAIGSGGLSVGDWDKTVGKGNGKFTGNLTVGGNVTAASLTASGTKGTISTDPDGSAIYIKRTDAGNTSYIFPQNSSGNSTTLQVGGNLQASNVTASNGNMVGSNQGGMQIRVGTYTVPNGLPCVNRDTPQWIAYAQPFSNGTLAVTKDMLNTTMGASLWIRGATKDGFYLYNDLYGDFYGQDCVQPGEVFGYAAFGY